MLLLLVLLLQCNTTSV